MGGVTGETNGSLVVKETVNGQPKKEVIFGDILWVKLHEASWWPAQVVDENAVSLHSKPSSKGSSGGVLVRLYGSYIYKYVDVHRSRAEFKKILEEHNFNYDDIMKKSLEKDLLSLKGSSKKRQRSKSKVTEASQKKASKKDISDKKPQSKVSSKKQTKEKPKTTDSHAVTPDRVQNGIKPSTPKIATSGGQELSGRRMKVMQNLGLVAPLGSPFPRNRVISPNPTVLN